MGKGRGKCYALDCSYLCFYIEGKLPTRFLTSTYIAHICSTFTKLGISKQFHRFRSRKNFMLVCVLVWSFFFQVSLKQSFTDKIETSFQNRSRPHGMLLFQKCQSNHLHPRKECLAGSMCNDGSMLLSYWHIKNFAAFHNEMTKKPHKKVAHLKALLFQGMHKQCMMPCWKNKLNY